MEHVTVNGNIATFKANLIEEYSATPVVTQLGEFHNEMTFRLCNGTGNAGYIIWNYGEEAADEDETVIGLSFEGKLVTDYDGVFELPREAVYLLEQLGYDCSEVTV